MQPHQNQLPEITPKILFIGDSAVGKSALLTRVCGEGFYQDQFATIGLDYKIKSMNIDGRRFKVQLWDTGCKERYESIAASFYKKVSGVVLCYAIDNRTSFERVSHWIQHVDKHGNGDICKILVATKGDLDLNRVVKESEGRRLAESYGIGFMETSAKENRNVKEIVEMIVKEVIRARIKTEMGISILKPIEPKKMSFLSFRIF